MLFQLIAQRAALEQFHEPVFSSGQLMIVGYPPEMAGIKSTSSPSFNT
jgi:hypothetical protein